MTVLESSQWVPAFLCFLVSLVVITFVLIVMMRVSTKRNQEELDECHSDDGECDDACEHAGPPKPRQRRHTGMATQAESFSDTEHTGRRGCSGRNSADESNSDDEIRPAEGASAPLKASQLSSNTSSDNKILKGELKRALKSKASADGNWASWAEWQPECNKSALQSGKSGIEGAYCKVCQKHKKNHSSGVWTKLPCTNKNMLDALRYKVTILL